MSQNKTPAAPPRISCVITAHERPDVLAETIRSALGQTLPPIEVIVVDDGSKADLGSIARGFGAPVRYIRLDANGGANAARNRGVREAAGDYVAMLDDDDRWRANKLERQIAALGAAEACLCGYRAAGGRVVRVQKIDIVDEAALRQGNKLCGMSGLLARREALLAEPFDEDLPKAQDWDEYVRLARRRPLAYAAADLFDKGDDGGPSITSASAAADVAALDRRAAAFDKHRDWLGERRYRERLAETLLAYIGRRRNKAETLAHALRRAGPVAVARYFIGKALKSDRQLRPGAAAQTPRPLRT